MFTAGKTYGRNSPPGPGGKIFTTLFGIVVAGLGVIFCEVIFRDASAGLQTWHWQETPCIITVSTVVQQNSEKRDGDEFAFSIKYTYMVAGREIVSPLYQLDPASSDDYGKMARLAEHYPVGAKTICYVNSNSPDIAVLARYNLLTLFAFLFPLAFMAIGALIAYSVWKTPSSSSSSLSAQAASSKGKPVAIIFCVVILLIAGLLLYVVTLRPISKITLARSWPAVPCNIISSSLKTYRGRKGSDRYSINIFYSYDFNGHRHKSNAYDFTIVSSGGYSGKQAVVSRYRPGTKSTCYVNPSDPTEAVLMRGFSNMMWIGLIPLIFVGISGVGLVALLRRR